MRVVASVALAGCALAIGLAFGGESPPVTHEARPRVASAILHAVPTTSSTPRPRRPPATRRLRPITGVVNAIGDSVMLDAAPALHAAIPTIDIDAAVSRSAVRGPPLFASIAASGRMGPAIVMGLAVNGGVTAERIDQVLMIAGGRRVVMITGHCPHCRSLAEQNATIRATCRPARRCFVADWDVLADKHPEWFAADGVHMGDAGALAYARLVRSLL